MKRKRRKAEDGRPGVVSVKKNGISRHVKGERMRGKLNFFIGKETTQGKIK